MIKHRYRMLVAYKGTDFSGWQVQPNGLAVQEVINKAFETIMREEIKLTASGRTDAGVHARGQVVHFDLPKPILMIEKFQHSLNGLLPPTIRILGLEPCSSDFHARYSAKRKIYHYFIHTSPIEDPFEGSYRWHIRQRLDHSLLLQACAQLVGTHDFKALANENHQGVAAHDSIRTLFRVEPIAIEKGLRIEFEGDGFLYKMVRNCTGLLIEVARGQRPLSDIEALLSQTTRQAAGYCAPAQALFLEKVIYGAEAAPSTFLSLELNLSAP